MKDLDDINGPIINDNNSSLIKEWTAANNFHCRLYENGHLIVEATMPNSTIVNIFENHANLKNKVKTVLLLGDIISIEGFYETKKVNKYFELIFPRGAFEGCENLTFFIIPKSVKNISRYAFSECKNLKSCNFKGKTFTLKKK